MKISRILSVLGLLSMLCMLSHAGFAQSLADNIRGGWIAEQEDENHVYLFVIKGNVVSGVYCHDCYDPDNLSFVDDGELTDSGITFSLNHDSNDGNGYVKVSTAIATLEDEYLQLDITDSNGNHSETTLIRSPRELRPAVPSGSTASVQPYDPPGPAEELTPDKVAGLWLAGTGPGKQYFIFREYRGGLRGMVCGPCIDAKSMAPMEKISIDGTDLHFDIIHENSGLGIEEHGPHSNVTVASIHGNELHLATRPSFADENSALFEMTLLGPVIFRANSD